MRDNININSSLKLFESYRDFSGGLNLQQSNEMMKDNQVTVAQNVDLALTSSIKKRTGRVALGSTMPWTASAPIQGLFKFVNNAETVLIAAVNGQLYYARPSGTAYGTWTQINITDNGSPFTFQTSDAVEAVQYNEWLYVATGTKLVRCQVYLSSGSPVASATTIVDQYKPTAQEALYVGTNALNTNPAQYLVDLTTGGAGTIEALGIGITSPFFAINVVNVLTAYVKTASPAPTVEYAWHYRKSDDTTWIGFPGFHPHSSTYKSCNFVLSEPGTYDVKVEVKLSGGGAPTDEYVIYGIKVEAFPKAALLPSSNIQKCRKILLHWDRLIIYDPKSNTTDGSSNEQDQIFISQVGAPTYFPTLNTISFAADTQQRVRKVVRYRNILLVFTPDTIQSLAGKSPADYVRSLINNQVGALWGNSVQVVENDVYFVSKMGIYAVRPNIYTQDNFNVASLDMLIQDQFAEDFVVSDSIAASAAADSQVVSAVFDNQYYLYSLNGKVYRHYFDRRAWVIDSMDHLGLVRFGVPLVASFNNEQTLIEPVYRRAVYPSPVLYPSGSLYPNGAGTFFALDKSVYADIGIAYTMSLRTKYFDLSQAFNYKKLRQLFIITRLQNEDVNLAVTVQADSAVILDPTSGTATVDPITHTVTWVTSTTPNFNFYAGTYLYNNFGLGINPLGENALSVLETVIRAKCRRVRLQFEHSDASPCEIYGFGLEFRSKKP